MNRQKLQCIFVHLHTHSDCSSIRLLDSINKIDKMIEYVDSIGQKSFALTDHECISNHVKYLTLVNEMKAEGKISKDFKPILGNEIYLVDENEMWDRVNSNERVKFHHFLLIAKDSIGHGFLRKLSTRAWERMFSYKNMERVPTFYTDMEEVIGESKGHLIGSTACLGGYFPLNVLNMINSENEDEIMEYKIKIHDFITWCINIFGKEDFYIEIQPSLMEEQIEFNKQAIRIANAYGLKYIITTDAHYLTKEDRPIHAAYLTSDEDGASNREVDSFYSSTHFFNVDEIFENMDYLLDDEIENGILATQEIFNKITDDYDLFHKQEIPKIDLQNECKWYKNEEILNEMEKYENIKKMIYSNEKYDRYLISLIQRGINSKISKNKYKETFERIDTEIKEIIGISKAKDEPVSSYFTTMEKNIEIIWDNAESLVMPSRGSAAGYIINYLLGITQINPLEQGVVMPHWRFISAERPDFPDIDIDYSSYKRDRVFKEILEYYKSIGGDVVRVCTFGTKTSKSAILTACRGLNINSDIGVYLSALIPVERGKVWSLSDCYYGNEKKNRVCVTEFKNIVDEYKSKNLLGVALGIEGLIDKRSSHACFDKETLITTSEGLKRIIDVNEGDLVLTHKNRFKPVVDTIVTKTNEEYTVYPSSSFPLKVTGNHPFLVRERLDSRKKIFSQPKWKSVCDLNLNNDYVGMLISDFNLTNKINNDDFYFEDNYIWTRIRKIEKENINDKSMYNLTVLDDSSYVANGVAVHNCGILIVNKDFTEKNAIMRTPSGERVSQFDLHDSELCGNIKYDFLNTKTCSMIQKTLEMLVENNKIEWQGSLRRTYDKYLHPSVINKDDDRLWTKLNNGELISAFQFDSDVGEQALKSIKPTNLLEAAAGNTLMRLMSEEGKEQPLDMYVRYKNDINEWYKDMRDYGLKDAEIELMKEHLLEDYGVCATQEKMMLISMDERIAGFNVVQSNELRKSVAKKKDKLMEKSKKLLYELAEKNNISKKLVDYVWEEQVSMQKGYSFSILHTIGYTWILVQQLNLILYYPPIYWNTAVLLVESGALGQDGVAEEDKKEKTTNYGTVAKAIGMMQDKNVKIELPDINTSMLGFSPNEKDDEIMFGFKGIMTLNNETAKLIIENRPFKSVKDFYERMVLEKRKVTCSTGKVQNKSLVSESQLIMLIKSGAFDKVENIGRTQILLNYLKMKNPYKHKLSGKMINNVIEMGIVPSNLKDELRLYKFREFIKTLPKKQDDEVKTIKWHKLFIKDNEELTAYTVNFFNEHFINEMTENKDYKYDNNGNLLVALGTQRKGSFEEVYKNKIKELNEWLETEECIKMYNQNKFEEIKDATMSGNISTWEMESMNYYYHEHELMNVDKEMYQIVNYNELSEEPTIVGFTKYKEKRYPKFELHRIVGTVLDKDKNRHTITVLTPSGVVTVKFYSGQFSFYDKQISRQEGDKKITLEDGWFKRGSKLLITGYRRGDQFKPKKYTGSIFPHTLQKILKIENDGSLILQNERFREEDV